MEGLVAVTGIITIVDITTKEIVPMSIYASAIAQTRVEALLLQ